MRRDNLRVQYPLWNIVGYLIMMVFSYGVVNIASVVFNDMGMAVDIEWNMKGSYAFIIGSLLLFIFGIAYSIKLHMHNKVYPDRKISAFAIRPNEYLDDDELYRKVTEKATKKVYSFLYWAIPVAISIMFFPFDRYVFIVALLIIVVIQNLLYYLEIRKYISE